MQHLLFITNCICMRHMNDRLSNLETPLKEVCFAKRKQKNVNYFML